MTANAKSGRSVKARRVRRNQRVLQAALARNGGARAWRGWKAATARKFVELADAAAGRMDLLELNLEGDMAIVYAVDMPVPRWPVDGELRIGDRAVFHLHYEDRWRWESPEGWAPLGLLQPLDPYHPNCRPALRGAICLGHLPPNVKPKEIALLGYYTLSLQAVLLDETDPNGVMNSQASEFFRNHPEYVPLTEAGLYEPIGETVFRSSAR
jgi:hypothetical protein